MRRARWTSVVGIAGGLALLGCGGGGAALIEPPPPVFTSVAITPDSASVPVGGVIQLTATPRDQNGTAISGLGAPTWTIEDTAIAVATGSTITGKAIGSTRVFASLTEGSLTRGDTARLVVMAAPVGSPAHPVNTPGTSFSPGTVTVAVGDSVTWLFLGATHNVTFVPGGPMPPGGDITDQASGQVVSRTFTAAGSYQYECTRHANMTGTVIVQSGQAQVFTSVGIAPATTSLIVGGTVPLTATPLDQTGVPMTGLPPATFSTSSAAIATVSPAGVVTATGAGTADITATIISGATSHSATATVLVTAPPPGGVTVSTTNNNSFSPGAVAVGAGGTVTWQFGNGTHNVTWNARSLQPPGGNIPDQAAGAQSRTFPTAGNYTYQCTRHNGMTGTVSVSGGGGAPVYTSLTLQPLSPSVAVGSTVQLIATPLDQNGTAMPGLPAATFASSDATVAIVNTTGLVTGVAPGTATITVTLTANGATHTAASAVAVGTGPGTIVTTPGLFFNPDDVRIPPGTTVTWQISGATHTITFETIAPPGGNIGATAPGNSVSRTFAQLGEYKYFCSIHGFKGKVRVE